MDIEDRIVGLIQAKDNSNLYDVGTVVLVVDAITMPDESVKLTLQGLKRFKINAFINDKNYLEGKISVVKETSNKTAKTKALVKPAIELFEKISKMDYTIPREFVQIIKTIKNPSQVADMIASSIDITNEERQKFLETTNVRKRLENLIKVLSVKTEQFEVGDDLSKKISRKAREAMNENQKQYYL